MPPRDPIGIVTEALTASPCHCGYEPRGIGSDVKVTIKVCDRCRTLEQVRAVDAAAVKKVLAGSSVVVMSTRDLWAISLMAGNLFLEEAFEPKPGQTVGELEQEIDDAVARRAYRRADALLRVREDR